MGKLIVVAVAMAIGSFVLADLLGPNSALFGGQDRNLGEIAGITISVDQYQSKLDQLSAQYSNNFGRSPSEAELVTLRAQAWELLIVELAFGQEYDKTGIMVSDEEIVDMVQGNNIAQEIQASFLDPNTGAFDRNQLLSYLQSVPSMAPQAQRQWYMFENTLAPGRLRIKFDLLMDKSTYVTQEEGKRDHINQNSVAEIKYLYIPYYSVNDSAIDVTEGKLKAYYNAHPDEYQVEESRSLKYVSFPIIPTADDSASYKEDLMRSLEDFKASQNDSVFANLDTDGGVAFEKVHAGVLPTALAANIGNLTKGDVRGPYLVDNAYALYKVSDIYEDTMQYAKARHILITWENEDVKGEARTEAMRIIGEINDGADFAGMARQYGTDGTATQGGELGWFSTGDMVDDFANPIFAANNKGLLSTPVETEYGYHIVDVQETMTNTTYEIATVRRDIYASDATRNGIFQKADYFAASVGNLAEFEKLAETDTLMIREANFIGPNDDRVGALGRAREVARWLYREGGIGKVSDDFELDNEYVVAVMTDETEKGINAFKAVEALVSAKVKSEEKGKIIANKLASMTGSLEEMAELYGVDAQVSTSSDLKITTTSLPMAGEASSAIGAVFSMESGTKSAPISVTNGVVLIELENLTRATDIADYSLFIDQLKSARSGRASYYISEAIKKSAKIVDERYKFY